MGSEPNFIKPSFNLDSPFKTPLPHTLLLPNGIINQSTTKINPSSSSLQNIEMVPLHSVTYTSLQDLLPATPPGSVIWPTYSDRKDSWREIPIKDPLLQHAAWAYLQPMGAARENDDRGFLGKFLDGCGGFFGCLGELLGQLRWSSTDRLVVPENVDDDDC